MIFPPPFLFYQAGDLIPKPPVEKLSTEAAILVVVFLAVGLILIGVLVKYALPVLVNLTAAITANTAKIETMIDQLNRLSVGLHERTQPSIAGLTVAYLRLAGYDDLADDQARRNKDGIVHPPEPRRRRPT